MLKEKILFFVSLIITGVADFMRRNVKVDRSEVIGIVT